MIDDVGHTKLVVQCSDTTWLSEIENNRLWESRNVVIQTNRRTLCTLWQVQYIIRVQNVCGYSHEQEFDAKTLQMMLFS